MECQCAIFSAITPVKLYAAADRGIADQWCSIKTKGTGEGLEILPRAIQHEGSDPDKNPASGVGLAKGLSSRNGIGTWKARRATFLSYGEQEESGAEGQEP